MRRETNPRAARDPGKFHYLEYHTATPSEALHACLRDKHPEAQKSKYRVVHLQNTSYRIDSIYNVCAYFSAMLGLDGKKRRD